MSVSNFWRLASGVWRLASGVWRLASGVWRLASGVWRLANRIRLLAKRAVPFVFEVSSICDRRATASKLASSTNRFLCVGLA
ncbi:hypothetical protein [Paraburkholderia bonniea]|uniref:hypothetical protein n=1 Tax=Paraburkholderia bonniea TaxID=2152891 RepID=UPI001581015D|nr:hypothetical protein [Paraburkholderia bonniea]